RIVGPQYLPGIFMQRAMREKLINELKGPSVGWDWAHNAVCDWAPYLSGDDQPIGARFLNGQDTITFQVRAAAYSADIRVKIESINDDPANPAAKIRFQPTKISSSGTLPTFIPLQIPKLQLITI